LCISAHSTLPGPRPACSFTAPHPPRMQVGSTPVPFASCASGFTVAVTAARTNNTDLLATCTLTIATSQVIYPPVLQNCGVVRSVAERSSIGTLVGAPLTALLPNTGTTALWTLISPPAGLPFSLGLCDGEIKVRSTVSWATARSWVVTVQATNDGSSIGLGTANASCSVTLNVAQNPLPPVILNLAFDSPELLPAGTAIGTLSATDPSNFSISNFSWAAVDTPNVFSVSLGGIISFDVIVDTLALSKNSWTYAVSVCNPYICGR
jgi:hypothetical protein